MRKPKYVIALLLLILIVAGIVSWRFGRTLSKRGLFSNPKPSGSASPTQPLQKYDIVNLANYNFQTSHLKVEKQLAQNPQFTSYLFSIQTLNKKMTGVMNVPTTVASPQPVIIMVRGFVNAAKYTSGLGTQHAGEYFASHGFITIAPDFVGYGGSDPESSDVWEARLQKPISVIELLKTIQAEPLSVPASDSAAVQNIKPGKIGFWAHSNGGQITLSALETLSQPYPTTLWAPVTAPFPYSILYFTDEDADEGKAARKWVAEFEQTYDAFDFSLTDHLDRLQGVFQLHQGTADTSVPKTWSDAFVAKVKTENARRASLAQQVATGSASPVPSQNLQPISLTYFTYPGAEHNLTPGWDMVVQRDLDFFTKNLGN